MPEHTSGRGYLDAVEEGVDAEAAARFARSRGDSAKLKSKQANTEVGFVSDDAAEIERMKTEGVKVADLKLNEEEHRVVFADISEIIDRYARTMGEAKAKEHLEKAKWYNRWFVRQTEAGYIEKYYLEAKAEILKNRNLLSDIQTKWLRKSEGKKLSKVANEAHFEILDEIIESLYQDNLRMAEAKENVEGKEHVRDTNIDAIGAELLADFVVGNIRSRAEFEKQAEEKLIKPNFPDFGKEQGVMYASNLFAVAEGYKKHFEELLKKVDKNLGPEQRDMVAEYLRRTMKLDVMLAKKQADIAREKPKGVMKWLEKTLNFTQNPFFKAEPKTWWGKALHKVGSLTLGNPVLYAFLGNRAAYGATVATGAFAAKTLGIGAAAALGIGPGMVLAAGAGIGAGIYLGIRAAVERFRDVRRRSEEAVLGKREDETYLLLEARKAIEDLGSLANKAEKLTEQEQKKAIRIMATLNLQDTLGKNLISVSKAESARYGSNFVGVQDLRKALFAFWEKKKSSFGETEQAQNLARDIFLDEAKNVIAEKIAKKDKETAREIRRRGLVVGAMGTVTTFAAACLAPGIGKLLKKGANEVWEFFAGNPRFDVSKTTLTEELWHKATEKFGHEHYPHYQGEFVRSPGFGNGDHQQFVEFPKNQQDLKMCIVQSPKGQTGGFLEIASTHPNQPVVRIPLDANGNILDESAFSELKKLGWDVEKISENLPVAAAPGSRAVSELAGQTTGVSGKKDFSSWIESVKSGKVSGMQTAEVHTKDWYNNVLEEDLDDMAGHVHNHNEVNFHITNQTNGDIKLDCRGLTADGSWRIVGQGEEMPDMLALRGQGKLKFVFIPDSNHPHDAILFDMDNSGDLVIPKGSKGMELFDPNTHMPKKGVVFGVAEIRSGANGSSDLYWVSSQKSHVGEVMDFSAGSGTEKVIAADVHPGAQHAAPEATGEKLASGVSQISGWRLKPLVYHSAEGFLFTPAGWRRQRDKDIDEIRHPKTKTTESGAVLTHGEAAGAQTTTATGTTQTTTGGGGGGERREAVTTTTTGTGEGGTRETTPVTTGATTTAENPTPTATETPVVVEARDTENKPVQSLVNYIRDFNEGDLNEFPNKNPHIKLEFEREWLMPGRAAATRGFVRRLLTELYTGENSDIHRAEFKSMNFIFRFQTAEADPFSKPDGTKVLTFNPGVTKGEIIAIMRRQLQNRTPIGPGPRPAPGVPAPAGGGGGGRGPHPGGRGRGPNPDAGRVAPGTILNPRT